MRRLRVLVDLTTAVLRQRPLTREEAQQIVEHLRGEVLRLFPGREESFEVIYGPRFRRLVEERFGSAPAGTELPH